MLTCSRREERGERVLVFCVYMCVIVYACPCVCAHAQHSMALPHPLPPTHTAVSVCDPPLITSHCHSLVVLLRNPM